MENLPKTQFDSLVEQMKLKNFHYLKVENRNETDFNSAEKKFIEKEVNTSEILVKKYEDMYPDLEIKVVEDDRTKRKFYIFGKIK